MLSGEKGLCEHSSEQYQLHSAFSIQHSAVSCQLSANPECPGFSIQYTLEQEWLFAWGQCKAKVDSFWRLTLTDNNKALYAATKTHDIRLHGCMDADGGTKRCQSRG